MPKVVILHPSDELYGADKVLLEIVGALLDKNDIEVWLPTDVSYPERKLSARLTSMGVIVLFVDLPVLRSSYLGLAYLPKLLSHSLTTWKRLRKAQPALVYINTAALAPTALIARAAGTRTVVHLHEDLGTPIKRFVVLPMVACANGIVAVSKAVHSRLPSFVQRKSQIIYNGFLLPTAAPPSRGGTRTFLLSSRWNEWKGHKEFLRAWDEAQLPDAKLVILGAPPEIGHGVDVEGIVATMKSSSSVEVVGQTEDVAAYLAACHVVVVPSVLPDPLPTIAIEALAAGRPVMASRIGGLPEIVEHGVTGWLLDPTATRSWVDALIEANNCVIGDLSNSSRQAFESRFGLSRFKTEIGLLVDNYVGRKTGS